MSLVTAMSGMLDNKAAMEAAEDIMMFEEDYAMEADELIDIMVDGKSPFTSEDAEIDAMEEEDEIEDQINEELEAEDDELFSMESTSGTTSFGKGSANPEGNVSGERRLTNDTLRANAGSVGQKNSSPNPANESFFDMLEDDDYDFANEDYSSPCCEEDEEFDEDADTTDDELGRVSDMLLDDDDFDDED